MNDEEIFSCNKGPLNLAHKHGRQAELKTSQIKFDEALVEHRKAGEYLVEALKLTSITQAVQSLTLQLEYHKRQKDIVQLKKVQYEIRKKIVEHQFMKSRQEFHQDIMATSSEDNSNEIQRAIFRTMEEADCLLDLLIINKSDIPTISTPPPPQIKALGTKLPKTEKNVIEELHTINIQLKKLIKQLMNELTEKDKQIVQLKSRLKLYEGSSVSDVWVESDDTNLDSR